jgi:DNA modification methylase
MRPLEQLVPYARNARTHSDAQIAEIAAAIAEFGFTNPVLADERGIIAGHGRVLAARQLFDAGQEVVTVDRQVIPKGKIPVIDCTGWSEAQRRAYVIADNRLAERAGWDKDLLAIELSGLVELGFDIGLVGFSDEELSQLLAAGNPGLTDPDEVPELPLVPVTQPGDVWILGRHRLVCGDCTDADVVAQALNRVAPHLMVTDPPYGVNYDPAWRNRVISKGKRMKTRAIGAVLNDDRADWSEAWALFPGAVAYVWHAGIFADVVARSLQANRFALRAQIVWVKTRHVLSRGDYHPQHEPALYGVREGEEENWNFVPEHEISSYAVRKGEPGHFVGGRKQSTVWFIENVKNDTGHGTQKPVECMKRPIENNSSPGQAVYDPFLGSGTTVIAAEMTGRACHAIELSEAYVDVAVQRWEAFTGEDATLEADGRIFKAVAAERDEVAA